MIDKQNHKRLPDFETYDRIEIYVVPRYKTSGMSGDEWRQHVQVDLYFKGVKTLEFGCRDMSAMAMLLGARMIEAGDHGISEKVIELESGGICDQPSCKEPSIGRLLIKQEFERGRKQHPEEKYGSSYRQFCGKHIRRGNCDLEDCDSNYEPMDGIAADASTNTESAPSRHVTVTVNNLDELPAAIKEARRKAGV